MKEDDMDRVLSHQDEILPSSGFVASVMGAVQHEAAIPPPIPFPWKRALPILILAGVALALVAAGSVLFIMHVGIMNVARSQTFPAAPSSLPSLSSLALHGDNATAWVWVVISLVVAWASAKLSMRMAGGGV
ncbi:MAG: hypothetical protein WBS24_02725 [Terriglobales bacterium]